MYNPKMIETLESFYTEMTLSNNGDSMITALENELIALDTVNKALDNLLKHLEYIEDYERCSIVRDWKLIIQDYAITKDLKRNFPFLFA